MLNEIKKELNLVGINYSRNKIIKEMNKKNPIIEKIKDNLSGGKADYFSLEGIAERHNVDIEKIKEQLRLGIEVELEHTDSIQIAREIAMDHIWEIPDYYDRLNKMEQNALTEGSAFRLRDYMEYFVYDLNDDIAGKEVSAEEQKIIFFFIKKETLARALISTDGTKVFVWNAMNDTHFYMEAYVKNAFNLSNDFIRLYLYKDKIATDGTLSDEQKTMIKENQIIKDIYGREVEVYGDETFSENKFAETFSKILKEQILQESVLTRDFRIGIELECFFDEEQDKDDFYEDALNELNKMQDTLINQGYEFNTDHNIINLDDDTTIEPDEKNQITAEYQIGGATGIPFVPQAISSLKKVMNKFFNEYGGKTNFSTGFHTHISFEGINLKELGWGLANIFLDKDKYEYLKELYSINEEYASYQPIDDLLSDLKKDFETEDEPFTAFELKQFIIKIIKNLFNNKYAAFRIHRQGTLEWRAVRDIEDLSDFSNFIKVLYEFILVLKKSIDTKELIYLDEIITKEKFMKISNSYISNIKFGRKKDKTYERDQSSKILWLASMNRIKDEEFKKALENIPLTTVINYTEAYLFDLSIKEYDEDFKKAYNLLLKLNKAKFDCLDVIISSRYMSNILLYLKLLNQNENIPNNIIKDMVAFDDMIYKTKKYHLGISDKLDLHDQPSSFIEMKKQTEDLEIKEVNISLFNLIHILKKDKYNLILSEKEKEQFRDKIRTQINSDENLAEKYKEIISQLQDPDEKYEYIFGEI
jgi:hypothetical protein